MSQFEASPVDGNPYGEPKTTSGLAVAALVCGILGCCGGVTGLIAVILGLAAVVSINGNAQKKGTGLAAIGIVIGLITFGSWLAAAVKFGPPILAAIELTTEGPGDAMSKAAAGDYDGVRDWFHGPANTASDEEIEQFITEAETRYGAYVACRIDENNQPQSTMGQQELTVNYIFTFANGDVSGSALLVFADPVSKEVVMKFGDVVLTDPDLGDLVFPAGGAAAPTPDDASDDTEDSETEGQE